MELLLELPWQSTGKDLEGKWEKKLILTVLQEGPNDTPFTKITRNKLFKMRYHYIFENFSSSSPL